MSLLSACCALNYLLGMCSCFCTRCHLVGRHGHSFLPFFFRSCRLSSFVLFLLGSGLGLGVSGMVGNKVRQSACIFYKLSNEALNMRKSFACSSICPPNHTVSSSASCFALPALNWRPDCNDMIDREQLI